jgi:hypothetical protein
MERLTRRSANGTGVYATPSGEPVKWENNRHNVLQKLADYEDLEEQGRLFKLPCKVGDTVYVIAGKNISAQKIQRATIDSEMKIEFCTKRRGFALFDIGKTVFPTESEAEAKLKELRGGEDESSNS